MNSLTSRIAAAVASIATTLVLFQSVALLAQPTSAPVQMAAIAASTVTR